jgi:hypothetical protein
MKMDQSVPKRHSIITTNFIAIESILMLVTDDGFKLQAETRSTLCVLKLLSKAVVGVTLLPYLLFIYLTSLYESLWFSVGISSNYVRKYDSRE